jgi:hypothetical protein
MKVGDLVRAHGWPDVSKYVVGLVICVDPEEIGDTNEVEVRWLEDNRFLNHSADRLEVISESR